jgi:glycerol-3-phosphate cytidylyltransferase
MTIAAPVIGYTAGVFDMFHIGHLNLLRNARAECDHLIVGVTTDDLAEAVKQRRPVIPLRERMEIVQSMRVVDAVVPQENMDKLEAWRALRFDVLFAGENMVGPDWRTWELELAEVGATVVFLPATRQPDGRLLVRTEDDLLRGIR